MNPIIEGISHKGYANTYDLREPFPAFRKSCGGGVLLLCGAVISLVAAVICFICNAVTAGIIFAVVLSLCVLLIFIFKAILKMYVYSKDKEIYYAKLIEWNVYLAVHPEYNDNYLKGKFYKFCADNGIIDLDTPADMELLRFIIKNTDVDGTDEELKKKFYDGKQFVEKEKMNEK